MSVNNLGQKSYEEFVKELQQNGYKTTSLADGETNFEQYANALSDDLQQQLMDSFDCEQDYELQAQIASLYNSNKSVLQSADFIKLLKDMGLNVSVAYQETTYISDYKAGNFSGTEGSGAIAIYTISDSNGGEIKIADANGNGALEVEEIFMNQILGDIAQEITSSANTNNSSQVNDSSQVNSSSAISEVSSVFETNNKNKIEHENIIEREFAEDEEISQNDFNKIVEKSLKSGTSLSVSETFARAKLGVFDMKYTGTYLEETEDTEIDENKVAS